MKIRQILPVIFLTLTGSFAFAQMDSATIDRTAMPAIDNGVRKPTFLEIDTDSNGVLSRDEAANKGLDNSQFLQFDTDGDNEISRVEYLRSLPNMPATAHYDQSAL